MCGGVYAEKYVSNGGGVYLFEYMKQRRESKLRLLNSWLVEIVICEAVKNC